MKAQKLEQPELGFIWGADQQAVINADPSSWQVVIAAPGTGKSAVACQRIKHLVETGVSPTRILVVSFSRTAVAELRDRIGSDTYGNQVASGVRVATIDSHAWRLRTGFGDRVGRESPADSTFESSIDQALRLFKDRNDGLLNYLTDLQHVLIDEAQDVTGIRADFTLAMLQALPPGCGVTVLADPTQAIYGFTTDEERGEKSENGLLARLDSISDRDLIQRSLKKKLSGQQPEAALIVFEGSGRYRESR